VPGQQPLALDPRRWSEVWLRLGARGDATPTFHQLLAAYSDPVRSYHNVEHLQHCLAELDAHGTSAVRRDEVEAGLWFHDAVYVPGKSNNEERSARLAETELRRGGVQAEGISRIAALVMATTHTTLAEDPDQRLICDVDLAILGSPPESFDRFEERIRQEYRWVPAALYRHSRSAVLRQFLERPAIYQTHGFAAKYEGQARRNLERLLVSLSG
jgi:predicted metal-dependent HD superfamily phosphohydrolase